MSKSFHNLHHRREDAVIVFGTISIDARTGRAFVVVSIVTSIVTIIIVSTVVDVAMIPRPPKAPTRSEVPAGMCPAVSATAAASVSPNWLATARACLGRRGRTPATVQHPSQSPPH
eukprot:4684967-Pyramimonas_sp.AAC.1